MRVRFSAEGNNHCRNVLALEFSNVNILTIFSGYWLIPNFISLLVNGITTFGRSTLNQVAQLDSRKRLEK